MKIKHIKALVEETLEIKAVTIMETYDKSGDTYYLCDGVIIILHHSKKQINLCFHVAMRPDTAALISIALTKIQYPFIFSLPFIYDKDGNVVDGEEAEKMFQTNLSSVIIKEFMQEQQRIQLLNSIVPESTLSN